MAGNAQSVWDGRSINATTGYVKGNNKSDATCNTPAGRRVCRDKIETSRSRARRTVKLLCYVNFALSWRAAMRHCDIYVEPIPRYRGGLRFIFVRASCVAATYTVVSSFPLHSGKRKSGPQTFPRRLVYVMNSDRDRNGVKNNCGINLVHVYVKENAKNCLFVHAFIIYTRSLY